MRLEVTPCDTASANNSIVMKTISRQLFRLVCVGLAGLVPATIHAADSSYHKLKEIPIGGEGGWDYATVDPVHHRLYVSHGNSVVVVDLVADKVVGEIADTPGVHGVALAPDLMRGLSTNGREAKASLVDLATLKTISKIETGQGPDGMLFEPGHQEFYTLNGRGQSATVIDATSGKVVATIELGGRPESAAADPQAGRVYDNLENKSEVAVIDTQSHTVVSRWPIAPGEEASGMAIDLANHRLFLGCGGSKTMEMMDSTNGKVLASVPIGDGVDANAFDPETKLAFASCRDGTVTIAHEDSPDKLSVVQTLKTAVGSRTMALDPTTHRIYLAAAEFEAPKPGQNNGGRRFRPLVPGSFKVLVFGTN